MRERSKSLETVMIPCGIVFFHPNVLDVIEYKKVPENAEFFTKLRLFWSINCASIDVDFNQLKREELKEVIEIFNYCWAYTILDISALYRSIYLMNGNSFNGLKEYENMGLSKLLSLIKIHNSVQDEVKNHYDSNI